MKSCTKCGKTKPLDQFHKQRGGLYGLRAICKICSISYSLHWRKAHAEHCRLRNKQWRHAHPEKCKEYETRKYTKHGARIRAANAAYGRKNRDIRCIIESRYRKNHPEKMRAKRAAFDARHPEKRKARYDRRRAHLKHASVIENIDRIAIYERDRGLCHLCRHKVSKRAFTLDHLIPLSQHGPHTALNVAVAHLSCNSRRGAGRIPAQLRLLP